MKITGAIFDLDGTLVDSLGGWDYLWDRFSEMFWEGRKFRPTEEIDKAVRTMILTDAMEYVYRTYHIGGSGAELSVIANAVSEEYYKTVVKPKEGVLEFLEYCLEHGVKMCIASASSPGLIALGMEYCHLGKYFPRVLSCNDIGKGKECPDIYLAALESLGTPLEETWVFEDSYVALETAHKLGMPTVAIYDKYGYFQDRMKATADIYIAEGETMMTPVVKKVLDFG